MTTTNKLLILALLLPTFFTSCTYNSDVTPEITDATIWTGPSITFTKESGADPKEAANQDRITDDVWITRGNGGGQFYNATEENSANKNNSPKGTLWARGTTEDLNNLTFARFRETVESPKGAVNKNLVMLLVEDNIAIDIKITSWATGQRGGFSYERSSE